MSAHLLLAALAVALSAGPAAAFITRTVPLKKVLADEQVIAVATVEAAGPPVAFAVSESLKGKFPADKLALDFTGDALAQREKHPEKLLPKLAKGARVVVFASKERGGWTAFAFADGAWFRVRGTPAGDGFTWALVHGEPYLRRTFKGTSAALEAVVRDCLAGKRAPPEPFAQEPPGFGEGARGDRSDLPLAPLPLPLAVIPSFVLIGPVALLAAVVPGVAARLAVGVQRWRAFLAVTGANTSLALLYFWLRRYLPDAAWAGPTAAFGMLVAVTVGGLVWATRRATGLPSPPAGERRLLVAAAVGLGLFVAGVGGWVGWGELLRLPWAAFTAAAVGAGLAAVIHRGEWVALIGTGIALAGSWLVPLPRPHQKPLPGATTPEVRILWESADYDQVLSGLAFANDCRVFGVSKQTGFRSTGAVVAVDLTGRERWRFDADGTLLPVFASPGVDDRGEHVYIGEGLHSDSDCRVFRVQTATGRPSWPKPVRVAGHVEGMPFVHPWGVFVPGGPAGVSELDPNTGEVLCQFRRPDLHIDTPPVHARWFWSPFGGSLWQVVFAGSGYGSKCLIAIDARRHHVMNDLLWRTPVELRSFGRPLVLSLGKDGRVAYGIGTGTLTEDLIAEPDEPRTPAGAVVCLNVNDGAVRWRCDLPKSVHTPLIADDDTVYAACRDGSVYAIDAEAGTLRWRRPVGATFLTGPALFGPQIAAVTADGKAVLLDPQDGGVVWACDLADRLGRQVLAMSQPVARYKLQNDGTALPSQLVVGVGLTNRFNGATAAAVVEISP